MALAPGLPDAATAVVKCKAPRREAVDSDGRAQVATDSMRRAACGHIIDEDDEVRW